MIDKILSKTGVGFALLFLVAELAYVNTISLKYMFTANGENGELDTMFGIIGALAFSMVTVLVMRLSKRNWLKVVFPFFDVALMFCGFNLAHASNLLDNPVRFSLSIFLSLFAGLITYSLGQINAEQHDANSAEIKINSLESELSGLKSKFCETESNLQKTSGELKVTLEKEKLLQGKFNELESNHIVIKTDNANLKSKLEVTFQKLNEAENKLKKAADIASRYKDIAMSAEVARIRKKAEKNRTAEEKRLLEEAA